MVDSLVLTVTRRCNLRCSYCPTAKDGYPSLSVAQALRAIELFCDDFGGGDVKLFGGEPLLEPDVVRGVLAACDQDPRVRRVYLSTNGLGLDESWLKLLRENDKAVLTLSLDGRPEDHRRLRRALPQVQDAYDHVLSLLPSLLAVPRVVVTQTIAPSTAGAAYENFCHLLDLGFRRFNFLPGYYLRWRPAQLSALGLGFDRIAAEICEHWAAGRYLYVRNLFTWAKTPFFNTGLVVDSNGSVHPNNLGLSAALGDLLEATRVGTLDAPPTRQALEDRASRVNELLQNALPPEVWQATEQVDRALTAFCNGLYPAFAAYRKKRRSAA